MAHPSSRTASHVLQVAVPPATRALGTLSQIDHEDAFLVDVGPPRERTAEQWARVVLEDAPASVRRTLQSGCSAIGLKRGGAPPERSVLGWEIRRSTTEFVLLGADSRIGMAGELLVKRRRHTLLFVTLVQQDNPICARRVGRSRARSHIGCALRPRAGQSSLQAVHATIPAQ